MIRKLFLLFTVIFIVFSPGCKEDKELPPKTFEVDSTAIKDSLARLEEEKLKIIYHYFPDSGRTTYSGLKKNFNPDELKIILAINRVDPRNFGRRDSVVVPDTFLTDFLRYSPFPKALDAADSIDKILLFSHHIQAFAAYEHGKLVRWGPASMGKKSTPTPNGLFHTNWKAKKTISTINPEWILPWAFNLDNFDGISIHQFDLPGYPASHACARLYESDAQLIYYWAEQWIVTEDEEDVIAYGTPVIIYDKYNFGKKPPWHYLPQVPDTTSLSSASLNSLIDENVETILERQKHREIIVAERNRKKQEADSLKNLSEK